MERTDHKQTENEQTEIAAHTAEADLSNGAAATEVSLGKFKDVNSLLKAYGNLESEFTRRSKRLRELEGEILKQREEITQRNASSPGEKNFGGGNPTTVGDSENTKNIEHKETVGINGSSVEAKRTAEGENAGRIFDTVDIDKKPTGEKVGDGKASADKKPSDNEPADKKLSDRPTDDAEEIVRAYLLSVLKNRPGFSPTLGTAVTAPPKRPRSFEEAGKMIKADLDN